MCPNFCGHCDINLSKNDYRCAVRNFRALEQSSSSRRRRMTLENNPATVKYTFVCVEDTNWDVAATGRRFGSLSHDPYYQCMRKNWKELPSQPFVNCLRTPINGVVSLSRVLGSEYNSSSIHLHTALCPKEYAFPSLSLYFPCFRDRRRYIPVPKFIMEHPQNFRV